MTKTAIISRIGTEIPPSLPSPIEATTIVVHPFGLAFGVDEHCAADQRQRRQRDDEERQPGLADQHPVQAATERGAQQEREQDREPGIHAAAEHARQRDPAEREHRPDRQVEPRGQQHERVADRHHEQHRHRPQDVGEVRTGQERVLRDGQVDHHQEQRDGDAEESPASAVEQRQCTACTRRPRPRGGRPRGRRRVRTAHPSRRSRFSSSSVVAMSRHALPGRVVDDSFLGRLGVATALATIRPRNITSSRSQTPSRSISSDELIRIAVPDAASSPIRRKISAFAPTSMPRVGSSSSQIFGCVAEPLPDDDLLLVAARQHSHGRLDVRRPDLQLRDVLLGESCAPARRRPRSAGTSARCRPSRCSPEPSDSPPARHRLRSSGTSAKPAAIASRGRADVHGPAVHEHLAA